jgi:uncharacterized membrane protein YgcG
MLSGGLWAALLPVLFYAGQASVGQVLPPPSRYVADYADVVEAVQEDRLNGMLQQLELTTGVQYIILTTRSTKGETLSRFAKKTAVRWKLRQPGRDKGLLFVLVLDDKSHYFEVGPDLRGVLTDTYLAQAVDDLLKPCLQAGRVSEGIFQLSQQIGQKIASQYKVRLSDPLQTSRERAGATAPLPSRSWMGWGGLLAVILALVVPCLWLRRSKRRSMRAWSQSSGLGEPACSGLGGTCQATGGFGGGFGAFGAGLNAPLAASKD